MDVRAAKSASHEHLLAYSTGDIHVAVRSDVKYKAVREWRIRSELDIVLFFFVKPL